MSWQGRKDGERWWLPTCPTHGHLYITAWDSFIYCAGIGWHLAWPKEMKRSA